MSGSQTANSPPLAGSTLPEWWGRLQRGSALLKHREYRQAICEFERVLALDAESGYASIAHHLRGYAHLQVQEEGAALQDFQRASALWPSYILPGLFAEWLEMAQRVDRTRDERTRRAERLETLATLASDDAGQHASIFLCLGIASWLRAAKGRAQYYLEQALRTEPDWPACFWTGLILASRNEPDLARPALARARALGMPAQLCRTLNWLPPRQRSTVDL